MDPEQFRLLLERLKGNEEEALELSNQNLTAEQFVQLLEVLKRNTSLKHLNLSGNALNNVMVSNLCTVLINHTSLESINLSHNQITNLLSSGLEAFVRDNPKVQTIYLDRNPLISSQDKITLEQMIEKRVKVVRLPSSHLEEKGRGDRKEEPLSSASLVSISPSIDVVAEACQQGERSLSKKIKELIASYENHKREAKSLKDEAFAHKIKIVKELRDKLQCQADNLFHKGRSSESNARYEKALEYYQQALAIRKRVHGDTIHSKVADLLHSIGVIYDALSQYEKTMEYFSKALTMRKSIHNTIHPDVASSFNSIGIIYEKMDQHEKALESFQEALAMQKSLYGDTAHSDIANLFNNFGNIYHAMSQYKKALEWHQQALEMRERIHRGIDHSDVASSLNNIGVIYHAMGQYEKALERHEKALAMEKRIRKDSTHPAIASSFSSIGAIYEEMCQYEKALESFQEALAMQKSLYGDTAHSDIANLFNNFGSIYHAMGQYKKALEWHQQALEMRERIHRGIDHSDVASSLNNIGVIYHAMGQYEKALERHEEALATRKIIYKNSAHPDIADSLSDIGNIYYARGQYEKTLGKYQEALVMRRDIHGDIAHPEIANLFNRLGGIYHDMGQYEKALEWQQQALQMRRSIYGGTPHSDVARSLGNTGVIYHAMRQYEKALECHQQALTMLKDIHGDKAHPDVASSLYNFGNTYREMGQHEKALEWHQQALKIRKSIHGDNTPHSDVADSFTSIGVIYDEMEPHEHEKALEYFSKALSMQERIHGSMDHPKVAEALYSVGINYDIRGQKVEALDYYRRAYHMYAASLPAEHYQIAEIRQNVASRLLTMARSCDETPLVTTYLAEAASLLEAQLKIDDAILAHRGHELLTYDFVNHNRLLFLLSQIYIAQQRTEQSGLLYAQRAQGVYYRQFPILALHYSGLAVHYLIAFPAHTSLVAALYHLRAMLGQATHRYGFAIKSLHKAIQLAPKEIAWEKQCVEWEEAQAHRLSYWDEDLYAQLERCQENYQDIQLAILLDLEKDKQLSNAVKNRVSETIIKLNNLLDMAYGRFVRHAIYKPAGLPDKNLHFRFEGAESALVHKFKEDRVMTDADEFREKILEELPQPGRIVETSRSLLRAQEYLQGDDKEAALTARWRQDTELLQIEKMTQRLVADKEQWIPLIQHTPLGQPLAIHEWKKDDAVVESIHAFLRHSRLLDNNNHLTTRAKNAKILEELFKECGMFSIYCNALAQHLREVEAKGGKQLIRSLGEFQSQQAAGLKPPLSSLIIAALEKDGWIELASKADLHNRIFRITEKFKSRSPRASLNLGKGSSEEKALARYEGYIVKKIETVLSEKYNASRSLERDFKPLYGRLICEQPFYYFREENNRRQPGLWRQSWLEKIIAISNDSKHIRLTPVVRKDSLAEQLGSFRRQRFEIMIDYLETHFHAWVFVNILQPYVSDKMTEAAIIRLSREMRNKLKELGYIDERIVRHPIAKSYLEAIKRNKDEESTCLARAFHEQLTKDFPKEWWPYVQPVADLMLHRVLQLSQVRLIPDVRVDLHHLFNHALKASEELIEHLGRARAEVQARNLSLSQGIVCRWQAMGKSKEALQAELTSLQRQEEKSDQATSRSGFTISELLNYSGRVNYRTCLHRLLGENAVAANVYVQAARALMPQQRYLGFHYYKKSIKLYLLGGTKPEVLYALGLELSEEYAQLGLWQSAYDCLDDVLTVCTGSQAVKLRKKQHNYSQKLQEVEQVIDEDIYAQLQHAKLQWLHLGYQCTKLAAQPQCRYLQHRIQHLIAEIVIKLRHSLDQVLARFVHKMIWLPNNDFNPIDEEHTVKFEIYSSLKQLEEKWCQKGLLAKDDHDSKDGKGFSTIISLRRHFPGVFDVLKSFQPFAAEEKSNLSWKGSWLEKIIALSNEVKHIRMTFLSLEALKKRLETLNRLDEFYSVGCRIQHLYRVSFSDDLGSISASAELVEALVRFNYLTWKEGEYHLQKGSEGERLARQFDRSLYDKLAQELHSKINLLHVRPIETTYSVLNKMLTTQQEEQGHSSGINWYPVLPLLEQAFTGADQLVAELYKSQAAASLSTTPAKSVFLGANLHQEGASAILSPTIDFSIVKIRDILPDRADTLYEIDVPGDGTCWLYSVMLETLLPLLNKPQEFQKAFKELFGENIQADALEEHRLLLFKYDGTLSFLKERNSTFEVLTNTTLRERLSKYLEDHQDELSAFAPQGSYGKEVKHTAKAYGTGDHLQLEGLSRLLKRPIVVYQEQLSKLVIMSRHGQSYPSDPLRLVFLLEKMHYHFLIEPIYLQPLMSLPVPKPSSTPAKSSTTFSAGDSKSGDRKKSSDGKQDEAKVKEKKDEAKSGSFSDPSESLSLAAHLQMFLPSSDKGKGILKLKETPSLNLPAIRHFKGEDKGSDSKDLRQFNHWYGTQAIESLVFLKPSQSLRCVFHALPSIGDVKAEEASGKKKVKGKVFENQVRSLQILKNRMNISQGCFIGFEPDEMGSNSHFIFGFMLKDSLVVIDPLGVKLKDFFCQTLSVIRRDLRFNRLYLSRTCLQKDLEGLVSCGTLCIELMLHVSQLEEAVLQATLASMPIERQERLLTTKEMFEYHTIDIAGSILLPSSCQGLLTALPATYIQQMEKIRQSHLRLLETTSTIESDSYEQSLFSYLTMDSGALLDVERDARFQHVKERFGSSQQGCRSSRVEVPTP